MGWYGTVSLIFLLGFSLANLLYQNSYSPDFFNGLPFTTTTYTAISNAFLTAWKSSFAARRRIAFRGARAGALARRGGWGGCAHGSFRRRQSRSASLNVSYYSVPCLSLANLLKQSLPFALLRRLCLRQKHVYRSLNMTL